MYRAYSAIGLLVVLGAASFSSAILSMPLLHNGLGEKSGLVKKVIMVGEQDRRRVLTKVERRKYAASGRMECSFGQSSVQVVNDQGVPSRVVAVSAHPFFDKNTCERFDLSSCRIFFPGATDRGPYKVTEDSIKAVCPFNGGDFDRRTDWAVFALDRDVKGVTPYNLPKLGPAVIPRGMNVVLVAGAGSDSFVVNDKLPAHIERCQIRERYLVPSLPLQTDCHSGFGASGSALLDDNGPRPTMLAVHSGGDIYGGQVLMEYDPLYRFNIAVPLEGDFLKEIYSRLEATRLRGPP